MGYANRLSRIPVSARGTVPDTDRRGAVREALAAVRSTLRLTEPDLPTPGRSAGGGPEPQVPDRSPHPIRRAMDAID